MPNPRPSLHRLAPEAMKAVLAVEEVVRGELDRRLLELVKLRASIVNGCAFCLDLHLRDLLEHGEDVRRVGAVAAWRESPFFTEAERAALALTDAVTAIGEHGVPDDVWAAAVAAHGERTVAHLVVAIGLINLWNRTAIATHQAPPPLAEAAA
mgnify:CR=1 FL=1